MPSSSIIALRKGLRAMLLANSELATALGGSKIYDEAPAGAARPYMTFGETQSRDWSGVCLDGDEHIFELIVWTNEHGLRQALDIAATAAGVLKTATPTIIGFQLVDLSVQGVSTRRDKDGRFARAHLRCRAVTETA